MVAFFGARLLMRMHGVSPTVSTTLSNSRPRPLVCRSPFVMSSPHDVRALSRPRSQQRTLYPTVRRVLLQGRRDSGGQRHLRDVQRHRHQAVVADGTDEIDDAALAEGIVDEGPAGGGAAWA